MNVFGGDPTAFRTMATINASTWKQGTSVTPSIASLPYVEIDESSLRVTPYTIQGYGVVYEDGAAYQTQFTYYGRFNTSSQSVFLNSSITGANLATPELGGFSIQGISLKASDFLGDPSAAARKMLQGNDEITGTAFDDVLDGYLGNDVINAGAGNDQIYGGAGRDYLAGDAGSDSFFVETSSAGYWTYRPQASDTVWFTQSGTAKIKGRKRSVTYSYVDNDYDVIRDFNPAEDTISTHGGTVDDVHTYQENTAAGIVIFERDTNNVMAVLSGINDQQFMAVNNQAW